MEHSFIIKIYINMKTFLIQILTKNNVFYTVKIDAKNFCEAEKKALLFPNLEKIIQILYI